MSQVKKILFVLIVTFIVATAGCSSANKEAQFDPNTGKHPADWYVDHRTAYPANPSSCTKCHGSDLRGGDSNVSCFSAGFNGMSCHPSGPSGHPAGWANPDSHGAAAKGTPNAATGFASCQICHGANFSGDIGVSCLNTAGCHGANVSAPHSPVPWGGGTRTHTTTNPGNAFVCGLCHLGGATTPYTPLPPGVIPDCFNNTLCHGQKAAPHAVPFTDPALHGPPAKADLTYCEGCHANPNSGGPGSNPRFNVAIGSLATGCEGGACHEANSAHPAPWKGILPSVSATAHQTAGNMAIACVLCHGTTLGGSVIAPACSTCHASGSPLTALNCTSCHGNPPTGTTVSPNRAGAHTAHNALTNIAGICGTCHNGAGNGTLNHDYTGGMIDVAFTGTTYNAKSGAATYNAAGFMCTNVSCHGGQTTPNWLTGAINLNTQCGVCHVLGTAVGTPEWNSYYSGRHDRHVNRELIGCTQCHDTTKLAAVHFNDLNTTAMTRAYLTLLDALIYTRTGSGSFGTCTPACHNTKKWQ
jgi:predicted CxxxxCH...CXXCH cytochrome family protein